MSNAALPIVVICIGFLIALSVSQRIQISIIKLAMIFVVLGFTISPDRLLIVMDTELTRMETKYGVATLTVLISVFAHEITAASGEMICILRCNVSRYGQPRTAVGA